jgi:hypothetical protein
MVSIRERPMTDARTEHRDETAAPLTPAELCRGLLGALDASEGRRRRRARNTTADAIGLGVKRDLLEAIVRDDPPSEGLEQWLLTRCVVEGESDGPLRAMALSIWDEWRLAVSAPEFRAWLAAGAPSDDRGTSEGA